VLVEKCAWRVGVQEQNEGRDQATFLAERYGGQGIGYNGGGVRCGLSDGLQIKGIGCNPLVGENAPVDYAHGGLSLFECMQESLWSRVFAKTLPFGAVETEGIIRFEEQCGWVLERWGAEALVPRYGNPPQLPRAILVRKFSVRPAHFVRASLFRPACARKQQIRADVERVFAAQAVLPGLLPQDFGARMAIGDSTELLEFGMIELSRRLALQSSAAKAKRLVHGNITASNICLDGRWIDFGSATALPNWGPPTGYGPYWDDAAVYADIFHDLLFASSRTGVVTLRDAARIGQACVDTYVAVHEADLDTRLASLTGIPRVFFREGEARACASRLARTIRQLMKVGTQGYLSPHPDQHASYGRYRIGSLMRQLATAEGVAEKVALAQAHLGDCHLAQSLVGDYEGLWSASLPCATALGVSPGALRRLSIVCTAKRSVMPDILFRERMVRLTEALVREFESADELRHGLAALHDQVDEACAAALDEPDSWVTTLPRESWPFCRYDALRDVFTTADDQQRVLDDDQIGHVLGGLT